MAHTHAVELRLGATGQACAVWSRYEIVQDMLSPGSPWTFTLFRSQAEGSAWDFLRARVLNGSWVGLTIDGAPVLIGQVETRSLKVDPQSGASLTISGRDLSAPLLDGDVSPRFHRENSTLEDTLRALFEPYGIDVLLGVHAQEAQQVQQARGRGGRSLGATAPQSRRQKVRKVHPEPGEKTWALAESLCRRLGLLLWIAPTGLTRRLGVIVDTPRYDGEIWYRFLREETEPGRCTPDTNLLRSDSQDHTRGIPTDVTVLGGTPHDGTTEARICEHYINGLLGASPAVDAGNLPDLPRVLRAPRLHSPAEATQLARNIIARAMATHRTYECTVQGHGQRREEGRILYTTNTMCHVRDTVSGLDEDMLITRVQFSGDTEGGQTTTLAMHPKGAIDLTPAPESP